MSISEKKPWTISKRVLPQHTDHGGIMWHGAYVAWLEEARVEALEQAGLPYQKLLEKGLQMPVIHLDIRYLKSLRHGDEVLLESWPLPCNGVRWPWCTYFLNKDFSKVASAKVDLVLVRNGENGQRIERRPPEDFLLAMKRLQFGPHS